MGKSQKRKENGDYPNGEYSHLLCCIVLSAIDVTNLIVFSLHLSASLGVTERKETVKSEGHRVASITGSFVEADVQINR